MSAADKARKIVQDVTGMWWPAGDEGDLRTAASAWRTFAEAVEDVAGATNSKAGSLVENNRGQSIDAFEEFWSRYYHRGHGWLKDVADAASSMADALDKYADAVAGAKKKLEHELEIVGATLVAGTALAFFTAGLSESAAAGAAAGVVELASTLGVSVSTEVATIAGTTLTAAAFGGVESVTVDLAVTQPVAIATGEAKGFNLDEAREAGTTGFLMGGALGGAGATAHAAAEAGGLRNLMLDGSSLAPKLNLDGLGGRLAKPSVASIRPSEGELPKTSRPTDRIPCERDPVDVVTGAMLLPQTDVILPGALPLVFTRTHLSTYGAGEWFGPSWASTLDERLQLDDCGVIFAASDGMRLVYPVPHPDRPVLPELGPRWPLEWDGRLGGVMTVTDPATGIVRTFSHPESTPAANVIDLPVESIEDRSGQHIDFERTDDGIPLAIHHTGGYRIGIETTGPRVTGLTLGDERLIRYGYDADGNLTEVVNSSGVPLRFTYDKDGRITSWTDRNDTSYHYTYDDRGRVTAVGGTGGFLAGAFAYDEPGRTTTVTDSLGQRSVFRYDAHCKVVAETDPLGNTTLTEWDERGEHPLSVTDPLGRVTRYAYDEAGNLVGVTLPDGSTGRSTYNALGLPVEVIEPGGATWRHEYDDRGCLTSTTDPTGATIQYAYDSVTGHLTTVTDATGAVHRLICDPAGLSLETTDALGATTRAVRDAFGRITEVTDPLGHTTRLGWTAEGKPAWRDHPDGARETWAWDGEGNLLAHTDPTGHTTRITSGPFDLPVCRTDPDGTTYVFAYDTELRLTEVTNPQGLRWRYAYDPAGRLGSETDFNGRTVTYEYDAAGQLTARTNGAGETICFERDVLGRTVRQGDATTFDYDQAGHLIRAANADATVEWQRDALGRVLRETTDGRTVSYDYDLLGRRTRRTTPSGAVSAWTYDAAGHPVRLATGSGELTFTHDAAGRETERRLGGAVTVTQTWDRSDRITSQTVTGAAHSLLHHRAYAYGPDGLLAEIRDLATGTRHLAHDPNGRVTAVTAHAWREGYAYDPAGNLVRSGDTELEHTGTLLHTAARTTYDHDPQGRLTRRTKRLLNGQTRTWTYAWDAEDRLKTATTPDGETWHYAYDPLGRRTGKHREGSPDRLTFVWEGITLAEQTTSLGETITWDYSPGTHRVVSQTTNGTLHAVVTDPIGTPTELLTPTGQTAWQHRTTLWGTPLPPPTPNTVDCPLRFPGQYADLETGLHYNYFRYYDPEAARYVTPDPLGLEPADNHYAYVRNPFVWVDLLGLAACTDKGGWYGALQPARTGNEINHIPAKAAYKHLTDPRLTEHMGPAIRMEKADHRDVMSTGSSREAKAWQARQRMLIGEGKIDEAMKMDIDDIRARFGTKYDQHIQDMVRSLPDNKGFQTFLSQRGWTINYDLLK